MLTALTALGVMGGLSPPRRVIAASLVAMPYLAASFLAQSAFKETAMALLVLAFAVALRDLAFLSRNLDYGGGAHPTCQVLPPGVPGFVPYCPYGYRLAAARRLVRAAHAVGSPVSLIGFTDDASIHRSVFEYLASVLRQIGLEPHLTWTSHAAFTDAQDANLIPQGWYADYPAASDFFGLFLACNGVYNSGKFCDRALDREHRAVVGHRASRVGAALQQHTLARPHVDVHVHALPVGNLLTVLLR